MSILSDLIPPQFKSLGAMFTIGLALGTGIGAGIAYGLQVMNPYSTEMRCGQIECSQIDQAKYQRLKLDITLTEVEAILGPGTEISRSATEAVFVWRNIHGYSINATFVNGKLQKWNQEFGQQAQQ